MELILSCAGDRADAPPDEPKVAEACAYACCRAPLYADQRLRIV